MLIDPNSNGFSLTSRRSADGQKLLGTGKTLTERFYSRVDKTPSNGCWYWIGGLDTHGYGQVTCVGKTRKAHRVAWFLVKGDWPNGSLLHSCNTPKCVNTEHLREGDHYENMQDRIKAGGFPHGEACPWTVLKEHQVIEIRHRFASGETLTGLGREFGVTKQNIRAIVNRVTWREI